jgi:hypothetical protein
MADTPLLCPHCGARSDTPLRTWIILATLGVTFVAVAVATIAIIRIPEQAKMQSKEAHGEVYESKTVGVMPPRCVDSDSAHTVSLSRAVCALAPEVPISDRLNTPLFSTGEINAAINTTGDAHSPEHHAPARR